MESASLPREKVSTETKNPWAQLGSSSSGAEALRARLPWPGIDLPLPPLGCLARWRRVDLALPISTMKIAAAFLKLLSRFLGRTGSSPGELPVSVVCQDIGPPRSARVLASELRLSKRVARSDPRPLARFGVKDLVISDHSLCRSSSRAGQ